MKTYQLNISIGQYEGHRDAHGGRPSIEGNTLYFPDGVYIIMPGSARIAEKIYVAMMAAFQEDLEHCSTKDYQDHKGVACGNCNSCRRYRKAIAS